MACTTVCSVYKGLVPKSPKTTPSAASMAQRSGWLSGASGLALSRAASGWAGESIRFTLLGQLHRGNCVDPAISRFDNRPTCAGVAFLHLPGRLQHILSSTIMRNFLADRPKTRGLLIALGVLVLLVVLFSLFFDWNLFRPTLARMISEKTGRHTVIRGNLRVHLWSFEPSAEIDGLTMDNPPWTQHAVMFTADELTVSVSLGRLLRGQVVVPQIKVVRPAIDVERDAKGRA